MKKILLFIFFILLWVGSFYTAPLNKASEYLYTDLIILFGISKDMQIFVGNIVLSFVLSFGSVCSLNYLLSKREKQTFLERKMQVIATSLLGTFIIYLLLHLPLKLLLIIFDKNMICTIVSLFIIAFIIKLFDYNIRFQGLDTKFEKKVKIVESSFSLKDYFMDDDKYRKVGFFLTVLIMTMMQEAVYNTAHQLLLKTTLLFITYDLYIMLDKKFNFT